jgi:hypothetical protein
VLLAVASPGVDSRLNNQLRMLMFRLLVRPISLHVLGKNCVFTAQLSGAYYVVPAAIASSVHGKGSLRCSPSPPASGSAPPLRDQAHYRRLTAVIVFVAESESRRATANRASHLPMVNYSNLEGAAPDNNAD